MNRLATTLAVIALAVSAHAQDMNVIPSFIVPGEGVAITVSDPARPNQLVRVTVHDPGGSGMNWAIPVQLDGDGNGIGIWIADVTGWDSLWCTFYYHDGSGGAHFRSRQIHP